MITVAIMVSSEIDVNVALFLVDLEGDVYVNHSFCSHTNLIAEVLEEERRS